MEAFPARRQPLLYILLLPLHDLDFSFFFFFHQTKRGSQAPQEGCAPGTTSQTGGAGGVQLIPATSTHLLDK